MPPASARIGGILTLAALLATIGHQFTGKQAFALIAALFLGVAALLFSTTLRASRVIFVLVGAGLIVWAAITRDNWAAATLSALTRGAFIIALFTALSALRTAAMGSQVILDCGRFLARQSPGRRYGAVLPCLVSAALMIGLGWLMDSIFKPQLAIPAPPRALESDRWLVRLRPLLILLAIVVGGVLGLHLATGVGVTGAVMAMVPMVAMGWVLIQPEAMRGGRAAVIGTYIGQFATREQVAYRGEIVLLSMAGFIGSLGAFLLTPIMQAYGPDISALPPLLVPAALVWIIPLTGQIGMNLILARSLLVPLLPIPAKLGISPAAMAVAITGGWAISGNTSPFTASVLLFGSRGKVEPREAGIAWNGVYALAAATAIPLWAVTVAALM